MDRQRNSRQIDQSGQLARVNPPQPTRVERMVGRVVQVKSAPKAGVYVLVNPVDIGGPETEGQAYTASPNTSITIPVAILQGSPVVGDDLVCKSVVGSGRWVAEKQGGKKSPGGGGVTLPNCYCSTPTTVYITTTYDPTPTYSNTKAGCPPGDSPSTLAYFYRNCSIRYYSSGFPDYVLEIFPNPSFIYASDLFTSSDPNTTYSKWWYRLTCYLYTYTWIMYGFTNFDAGNGQGEWQTTGLFAWSVDNRTSFCDPFLLTGPNNQPRDPGFGFTVCGGTAMASG